MKRYSSPSHAWRSICAGKLLRVFVSSNIESGASWEYLFFFHEFVNMYTDIYASPSKKKEINIKKKKRRAVQTSKKKIKKKEQKRNCWFFLFVLFTWDFLWCTCRTHLFQINKKNKNKSFFFFFKSLVFFGGRPHTPTLPKPTPTNLFFFSFLWCGVCVLENKIKGGRD